MEMNKLHQSSFSAFNLSMNSIDLYSMNSVWTFVLLCTIEMNELWLM